MAKQDTSNTDIQSVDALKELILHQEATISSLSSDVAYYREAVEYLKKQLYGSKSEKTSALVSMDQLNLFDEAEIEVDERASEPELIKVAGHMKKKFKGQREELLASIPHTKVLVRHNEEDMCCERCNTPLSVVGEVFVRTEVEFIPAQVKAIDYYRETCECRKCRKNNQEYMSKAPMPYPVIQHSMASPSSVAWIMYQKYVNAMPLYRQESDWVNMGIRLSRATMANWVIYASNNWLKPIYNLMHQNLRKEKWLHADETPIQVLKEEGRKNTTDSYMWVYSTVSSSDRQIRLLEYQPGRGGKYPMKFLEGFQGYLHTDAYAGYNKLDGVKRCLCWAHLRRKFVEALPSKIKNKKSTLPYKGIEFCNELFKVEEECKTFTPAQRYEYRNQNTRPILNNFWTWVETQANDGVLMSTRFGDAIKYAINHKEEFMTYLEDGHCSISNNLAENSIRGVCVGKKNYLFSASPEGATASGIVYSMVETAKANKINPYKYLKYIFESIPGMAIEEYPEILEEFLPWHLDVQQQCK